MKKSIYSIHGTIILETDNDVSVNDVFKSINDKYRDLNNQMKGSGFNFKFASK